MAAPPPIPNSPDFQINAPAPSDRSPSPPTASGSAPPPIPDTPAFNVGAPAPSRGAQATAPSANPPSAKQSIGAGLLESVHDVTDWPAQKLASGVGALVHAVGLAPNWTPGKNTTAQDVSNAQAYQQQYGANPIAQGSRIAGDIAGSTAMIGAGEGALGMLGNAVRGALPAGAANVVSNAGRFASGNAPGGILARGTSLATRGALEGAAANESVSGNQGPTVSAGLTGAAIGAPLAPLASVAGKGIGVLGKTFKGAFGSIADTPGANQATAAKEVLQKLAADGISPQAALASLKAMGPDATLADVGGENLKLYAEALANRPGVAAELARATLEGRAEGAEDRITDAIKNVTGQAGDIHGMRDSLIESRSKAAAPLYEKAFSGGSTAPLEQQLQSHFNDAAQALSDSERQVVTAQNQLTAARAKATQTQGNVYSTSAANREMADAQDAISEATQQRDALAAQKNHILGLLQQSQNDRLGNVKGAVWSPRIQQFIDDPLVKSGIAKGIQLERLDALAAGKPLNPTEYAITGTDESGDPIVGNVPNMRLLDAAKRGLDSIVTSNTDDFGRMNQYGRAVNGVRAELLKEMDKLNPDYAVARAAWSGPTRSLEAQEMGRKALNNDPEITTKAVSALSPNDKAFFLNGVARSLLDKIESNAGSASDARTLFGRSSVKKKLMAALGSQDAWNDFQNQMEREIQFSDNKNRFIRGSQTARRQAARAETSLLPRVINALHNPVGAAAGFAGDTLMNLATKPSENLDLARGRMLFQPGAHDEIAAALARQVPGIGRKLLGTAASGAKRALIPAAANALGSTARSPLNIFENGTE